MINIKLEVKGLKALQMNLTMAAKEVVRAEAMALNRTVAKAKTEMKRAISAEFSIPQKSVAKRLHIRKARRTGARLEAVLFVNHRSRSLNAIHFLEKVGKREQKRRIKEEGNRPQLRFKIKKSGSAKTIRGAFVANRGRTVFRRTGKGRLPIKPVQTIGVAGMFNARRVNRRVIARIRKEFPIELDKAIGQVIRRRFK